MNFLESTFSDPKQNKFADTDMALAAPSLIGSNSVWSSNSTNQSSWNEWNRFNKSQGADDKNYKKDSHQHENDGWNNFTSRSPLGLSGNNVLGTLNSPPNLFQQGLQTNQVLNSTSKQTAFPSSFNEPSHTGGSIGMFLGSRPSYSNDYQSASFASSSQAFNTLSNPSQFYSYESSTVDPAVQNTMQMGTTIANSPTFNQSLSRTTRDDVLRGSAPSNSFNVHSGNTFGSPFITPLRTTEIDNQANGRMDKSNISISTDQIPYNNLHISSVGSNFLGGGLPNIYPGYNGIMNPNSQSGSNNIMYPTSLDVESQQISPSAQSQSISNNTFGYRDSNQDPSGLLFQPHTPVQKPNQTNDVSNVAELNLEENTIQYEEKSPISTSAWISPPSQNQTNESNNSTPNASITSQSFDGFDEYFSDATPSKNKLKKKKGKKSKKKTKQELEDEKLALQLQEKILREEEERRMQEEMERQKAIQLELELLSQEKMKQLQLEEEKKRQEQKEKAKSIQKVNKEESEIPPTQVLNEKNSKSKDEIKEEKRRKQKEFKKMMKEKEKEKKKKQEELRKKREMEQKRKKQEIERLQMQQEDHISSQLKVLRKTYCKHCKRFHNENESSGEDEDSLDEDSISDTEESLDPKGYYKVLGISLDANLKEIHNAYEEMRNIWIPENYPENSRQRKEAETMLMTIEKAYNVLSDIDEKEKYDFGMEWDNSSHKPPELFDILSRVLSKHPAIQGFALPWPVR